MLSLQDIKHHIHSIEGTAKITSAMQMVAASQMRRAQNAALAGRPLMRSLYRMQLAVTQNAADYEDPLMEVRPVKRRCVILISTDKGLCGALNADVFSRVRELDPATTEYITVGRLAHRMVDQSGWSLAANVDYSERPLYSEAQQIAKIARERFLNGTVDQVVVVGAHFVNTLVQKPLQVEYLPVGEILAATPEGAKQAGLTLDPPSETAAGSATGSSSDASATNDLPFLFEPNAKTVLSYLLNRYLDLVLYQMLLDARASEHSARMVSMKAATENAEGLIRELNLQYNKTRQEHITNELLDISGGQAG